MISVVIPCYNAAAFIKETLDSVLSQEVEELEVIVIDDGSPDNTGGIVQKIEDKRIRYIRQENKGVSAARNKGCCLARGAYIIFFDADDQMPPGFLAARMQVMDCNPEVGFSCGPVQTFPVQGSALGLSDQVAEKLLTYDPGYSSCPSNYLIRRSVMVQRHISFNEKLSSTADRYFLIQLAQVAKGAFIKDVPLFYRVSPGSMSNRLTRSLVLDNERYYIELKKKGLIPRIVKDEFLYRIHYILGLGFLNTGVYGKGIKYLVGALSMDPIRFSDNFLASLRGADK